MPYLIRPTPKCQEDRLPCRYRFDLENGHQVIRDEDGALADSLDHAVALALECMQEMQNDGELDPSTKDWELVIRDEAGGELERIVLREGLPVLVGAN